MNVKRECKLDTIFFTNLKLIVVIAIFIIVAYLKENF